MNENSVPHLASVTISAFPVKKNLIQEAKLALIHSPADPSALLALARIERYKNQVADLRYALWALIVVPEAKSVKSDIINFIKSEFQKSALDNNLNSRKNSLFIYNSARKVIEIPDFLYFQAYSMAMDFCRIAVTLYHQGEYNKALILLQYIGEFSNFTPGFKAFEEQCSAKSGNIIGTIKDKCVQYIKNPSIDIARSIHQLSNDAIMQITTLYKNNDFDDALSLARSIKDILPTDGRCLYQIGAILHNIFLYGKISEKYISPEPVLKKFFIEAGRIFDCFTFYDELDLLDVRLQELSSVVDIFVIAEADRDHKGESKPFIFEQNKNRYSEFMHKIRYIKISDMPLGDDAWVRERFQRSCLNRGLLDLDDNDIVIVSDVDEIPRSSFIEQTKNLMFPQNGGDILYIAFNLELFQFKMNYRIVESSYYSMAARGDAFKRITSEFLRTLRLFLDAPALQEFSDKHIAQLKKAGWHFSSVGNDEAIMRKAQRVLLHPNFGVHQIEKGSVSKMMKEGGELWTLGRHGEIVNISENLPKFVIDNQKRFSDYLA